MDQASKTRLAKVHPELARRVERTIDALAASGLDVRVVQGLRTYAEQNALFEQGRSRKGPKVTNARGGQSNHNFGLAVDLCPFDDGQPDWNNDRGFTLIGAAAKTQGLEWGGDWESFPDRPHLQLRTGLKTSVCHELFVQHGLEGVWKEASRRIGVVAAPTSAASSGAGEPPAFPAEKIAAAEPVILEIPPKVEQPTSAVEGPREAAFEQPVELPAAPFQPPPPPQQEAPAPKDVEVRKERPSLFVRATAAVGVAVGAITSVGISIESLFNRSMDILQTSRLAPLVLGVAFGIFAMWMYDRSAGRSNRLNQQKIATAADTKANTVELT